jgi:hypothetical protein
VFGFTEMIMTVLCAIAISVHSFELFYPSYENTQYFENGLNAEVFFLISNFRSVLNVVCFLLGNSPASEFYMPTFRNTLSLPFS